MSQPEIHKNHLVGEKSLYLLQHMHNPVDWYPWGEKAFTAARVEDKPIFLSIGYATCHWCHVMEKESFQNKALAEMMNEVFINIKVDREEMPEIDSLYMEFAQAMMSGGAGWPLNVVLTPDLNPFFAATYLPPDSNRGLLGMRQLVLRIKQIWADPDERETVIVQAGKIVDVFSDHAIPPSTQIPAQEKIVEAAEMIFKAADPIYGGMKGTPKFPIGFQACFLLREARSKTESRALFYVERTLEMMHRGGIYDHLGGGFARYCIDEQWMVPHFEKMLYDNAILTRAYTEAYEFTRHNFYREIAEQTLEYVMRELRDGAGYFYCAEDADCGGKEGGYYTWTFEEIHKVLKEDASLFCEFYGASPTGNFHGRNILHMPFGITEFSAYRRLDSAVLKRVLGELRAKLWKVRQSREQPKKDDKVVTSYNGLMISAFCEAAAVYLEPKYAQAAEASAQFVKNHLYKEGKLFRRWRDGEAKYDGCLDDYAFMIQGLLSLFEIDSGVQWLEMALAFCDTLERDFKAENGAYCLTNGQDPHLILRRCEFYDGAEPSGNAVHAENLLRLYQMTGETFYRERAENILKAAQEHIELYPPGACYHLLALMRYYDAKAPTIIVVLGENEENREEIKKILAEKYSPHKAIIWHRESDETLRDLLPITRLKRALSGKTTMYICYADRCLEPITDLTKMTKAFE